MPHDFTLSDVRRARIMCWNAHWGQEDRDGKPHAYHCERVAFRFRNPLLRIVALLHDVLEDTTLHRNQIRREFGKEVLDAVEALTRGKQESWNAYMKRLIENPLAVQVKIADIEDNLARADRQMKRKEPMYVTALTRLQSLHASV